MLHHLGAARRQGHGAPAPVTYRQHAAPGEPAVEGVHQAVVQEPQLEPVRPARRRRLPHAVRLGAAQGVRGPGRQGRQGPGPLGADALRQVQHPAPGRVQAAGRGLHGGGGVELDKDGGGHD